MRYRRVRETGATYFFTLNLAECKHTLLTDNADILRTTMQDVRRKHPFRIDALVILPDHLHAIWTLPPGDADFATRWMLIKSGFSRHLVPGEQRNASRISKGEQGIWQRRYWEHLIRDEEDYMRHVDYIHFNPVKHGHVKRAVDWKYSSIHRYIRTRTLPRDWGCGKGLEDGDFGER